MIPVILFVTLTTAPNDVAHRRVVASDGASLALYRYGSPGNRGVLLVPDVGMGRAVFDTEGEGLAPFLAAHGRTVYVAELRGQGASWRKHPAYDLAQHVQRDLPAVLDAIGEDEIDLVAYGYEGTLALAASTVELKGRIGRVVAISTPVEAEVPSALALEVLGRDGDLRTLLSDARSFELLFAMGGRFRSGRLEALRARAFSPLGQRAAAGLVDWWRSGDLPLSDGTTVHGRLAHYDRPTLLFLGLADGFANPEFATPLPQISKATVRMRTFSRAELASEDYSHLSLLQGDNARVDVFEPALRFLNEATP